MLQFTLEAFHPLRASSATVHCGRYLILKLLQHFAEWVVIICMTLSMWLEVISFLILRVLMIQGSFSKCKIDILSSIGCISCPTSWDCFENKDLPAKAMKFSLCLLHLILKFIFFLPFNFIVDFNFNCFNKENGDINLTRYHLFYFNWHFILEILNFIIIEETNGLSPQMKLRILYIFRRFRNYNIFRYKILEVLLVKKVNFNPSCWL